MFAEYTSLKGKEATLPLYVRHFHEGNLVCVASAQNNSLIEPTVSNIHYLKVIGESFCSNKYKAHIFYAHVFPVTAALTVVGMYV